MCVGVFIEVKNNEFCVVVMLVGVYVLVGCGYEVLV